MRWNKFVTLLTPAERYQDDEGGWHYGEPEQRTIPCNEYNLGVMAMAHLRSTDVRLANANEPIDIGMRNEHMIEVRHIDYQGEDRCIFEGEEYEVMYASGNGEFRMLTIGQRIGNDRKEA